MKSLLRALCALLGLFTLVVALLHSEAVEDAVMGVLCDSALSERFEGVW